jgi:hypothetical protein
VAGVTTQGAVQASLDRLAADGSGIFARQMRLAQPLLSANRRIDEGSHAGLFATAVTTAAGVSGRLSLGNISLLGGIAWGKDDGGRAELDGAVTIAAALRYAIPSGGGIRPYVEAGAWTAPDAELRLSRRYLNGAGTAVGVGETEADISHYYIRAGAAVEAGPGGELALAAEIGRARLDIEGYAEPLSAGNPFEATIGSREERMTVLKLRGEYSVALAAGFDATLWGGAVWSRPDEDQRLVATVPGLGVLAARSERRSWAEFGARIGYDVRPGLAIELFADGSTGERGVGEGAHAGLALRTRF